MKSKTSTLHSSWWKRWRSGRGTFVQQVLTENFRFLLSAKFMRRHKSTFAKSRRGQLRRAEKKFQYAKKTYMETMLCRE